jgi:outer membrane protein TolC
LAVLLAALALLAAAPAMAAEELTVDKAVELALRQNQTLRGAEYQASAADWGFAKSFSTWLPKVYYDWGWTRVDDKTYNDAMKAFELQRKVSSSAKQTVWRDNYANSITVMQPIFNGAAEFSAIDAAYVGRRGAAYTEQDARLQTVLNTKKAYLAALKTHGLLAVARESLTLARESLRLAQARLEVGSGIQSDVLNWQAQTASAEGALAEAENADAQALMALALLIGGPVEAEYTLPAPPTDIPDAELDRAEQADVAGVKTPLKLSAHPAWQAAESNVDLVDAQMVGSAGKFFPNANFTYNYKWLTDDTPEPNGQTSWTAGITVEIPLFQGLAAITGVGQTYRQKQAARMTADAFDAAFLQRAHTAQLDLRSARLRVLSSRRAVEFSRANLEIINKRAELGMATLLDQLNAQVTYVTAKGNLIGAIADFRSAMCDWVYATAKSEE